MKPKKPVQNPEEREPGELVKRAFVILERAEKTSDVKAAISALGALTRLQLATTSDSQDENLKDVIREVHEKILSRRGTHCPTCGREKPLIL